MPFGDSVDAVPLGDKLLGHGGDLFGLGGIFGANPRESKFSLVWESRCDVLLEGVVVHCE